MPYVATLVCQKGLDIISQYIKRSPLLHDGRHPLKGLVGKEECWWHAQHGSTELTQRSGRAGCGRGFPGAQ